ncbi:MAG: hypothetical protein KF866_07030 [Phycisphaeraceae bacterium]|nr:hypothetical protein [Phycisphaeraceae bacterium]MCW5755401.1 hypothetical protein [Phycisphaeraceae bacterium]
MPTEPATIALIRFGCLAVAAAFFLLLFRLARIPGGFPAAILAAGLLTGVALGPTVLGALRPELHQRFAVGALHERQALRDLEERHELDLLVLGHTGVSPVALDEQRRDFALQRRPLHDAVTKASHEFQTPVRRITLVLVCLAVFLAGCAAQKRTSSHPEASMLAAAAAGILAVIFAGIINAILIGALLGATRAEAVPLGFALAGGSFFAATPLRWLGAAARSLDVRFSLLCGIGVVLIAIAAMPARTELGPWIVAIVLSLAAGAWLGRTCKRRTRCAAKTALACVVLPTLVAFAASHADFHALLGSTRAVIFVIIAVAITGLGAWMGFSLGMGIFGSDLQRHAITQRWIEANAAGVGLTQAVMLAVLCAAALIDGATSSGAAVIAAFILAALFTECSLDLVRRWIVAIDNPPSE